MPQAEGNQRTTSPPAPNRAGAEEAASSEIGRAPLTVSREALVEDGTDHRFRQLVSDLFTISVRINEVREHLARSLGVTGPQYSILLAIAHVQGGVGVGALARSLHVSSAFIATETGKLARRGWILKKPNPDDRRGVRVSLTEGGRARIECNYPRLRAVNDLFFGSLSRESFDALSSASADLVDSSDQVLRRLEAMDADTALTAREPAA